MCICFHVSMHHQHLTAEVLPQPHRCSTSLLLFIKVQGACLRAVKLDFSLQ